LIQYGALVNITDEEGHVTPLHLAAKEGHLKCVELLLSKGANPKLEDINHCNPFHYSCNHNRVQVSETLLNWDPSLLLSRDKYGWTGLHWAVSGRSVHCVQLLLKWKIDSQMPDINGRTAKDIAKERDFSDIIDLLPA